MMNNKNYHRNPVDRQTLKSQPTRKNISDISGESEKTKICSDCGAVYAGHWSWSEIPDHPIETRCPACKKIRNDDPDGILELKGTFFSIYRNDILNSLKVAGSRETSDDPLNRIMNIEDLNEGVRVTTTGHRMAVRLGNAIQHLYLGTLSCPKEMVKGSTVIWERD